MKQYRIFFSDKNEVGYSIKIMFPRMCFNESKDYVNRWLGNYENSFFYLSGKNLPKKQKFIYIRTWKNWDLQRLDDIDAELGVPCGK